MKIRSGFFHIFQCVLASFCTKNSFIILKTSDAVQLHVQNTLCSVKSDKRIPINLNIFDFTFISICILITTS